MRPTSRKRKVSALLTVGDLREAIADLPDDTRVGIDLEFDLNVTLPQKFDLYPVRAWVQASDVVEPPVGTDPVEEGTVAVLLIEMATEAVR